MIMDKDRIAALIEGIKRWNVYAPPGIRTLPSPWNDPQYYFHDCYGFDSLRVINSYSETSSPVALSDYIMNEGDK